MKNHTPLWEVFIRPRNGLHHNTWARCTPPMRKLAIQAARDVYTRRGEGNSIWVVPSAQITASDPVASEEMFEPGRGQGLPAPDILRHPR
jgi:phenylacetate-CoA oxygenase PaaH subunit